MRRDIPIIVSMIVFVLVLSLVLAEGGLGFTLPPDKVRTLASWFLGTTFLPWRNTFTAMAPEAVTAIVWDYRGLDTVFETFVLYLAIIGSVALMRGIEHRGRYDETKGMSIIGKTATKIILPMLVGVAAAIALHGHLTPGGGFQGGAAAAVAPLLLLVIFSKYFLEDRGISKERMLMIRSVGLLGIGIVALAIPIASFIVGYHGFILQNQPKDGIPLGFPSLSDGVILGGTLLWFNIFETLAVCAGFTILFLLLAIPEEHVRRELEKGVEHG